MTESAVEQDRPGVDEDAVAKEPVDSSEPRQASAGRLSVLKTYKLYIGGRFPRTESGRYLPVAAPNGEIVWRPAGEMLNSMRSATPATFGSAFASSIAARRVHTSRPFVESQKPSPGSKSELLASLLTSKTVAEAAPEPNTIVRRMRRAAPSHAARPLPCDRSRLPEHIVRPEVHGS